MKKTSPKSIRAVYISKTPQTLSFSSEDVEAFWSKVALHEYESANKSFADTHTQRFDISIPRLLLPPHGKLLNLWSRQGEAIPYIRERFPAIELVNAEISRVMLRQAKMRFSDEYFVDTDLQQIDYPDSYFDAILSLEMLEHCPMPQKILSEMFRVLKPNGHLVLTCPGLLSEIHLWIADRFLNNHGEGPHRFPSTKHVHTMLSNAGFTNIAHEATLFIPLCSRFFSRLNAILENIFQWSPANELGIRQLYEARKPGLIGIV
jgi:ubiquinone/menaquinone biosynthesis C-methylase UbiE